MVSYLSHRTTGRKSTTTPQTQPLNNQQVQNAAGGYGYAVDDWQRLTRFLILGSESGTYYVNERTLTTENIDAVKRCIVENGARVVETVLDVSNGGRAAKQDPTLYVLALCAAAKDQFTRQLAYVAIPAVCRTGTMLFQFVEFVNGMRGWSRGLRHAVASWYENKTPDSLAYQMTKYRERGGWSHKDVLRLAHPHSNTSLHANLYNWSVGKFTDWNELAASGESVTAQYMSGYHALQNETDPTNAAKLITTYNLPLETVPTNLRRHAEVWDALLEDMPTTALVRNLATMTRVGLIAPHSAGLSAVRLSLGNEDRIKRSRIHPITVLEALKTYAGGRSIRGSSTWTPVAGVVDALDAAFYTSFGNVEPVNSRMLFGLDVSGSMKNTLVNGIPNLQCREACGAMALVAGKLDPDAVFMAFDDSSYPLDLSRRQRLDDVVKLLAQTGGGATDCALPMVYATSKRLLIDTFVVLTDSQTWSGSLHPEEALDLYRQIMGIDARLVVVAMESTKDTIGNDADSRVLNVVGFDTATPGLIAEFAKGNI